MDPFYSDPNTQRSTTYRVEPIFLTAVLGASMVNVGLIEGLAESIASLLKVYAGAWSDRRGRRKPFIVGGYFLGVIAKPLTGLATSWTGVLAARALDRAGKGVRTAPRDALLAESVGPENRGAAFGWHRSMDTLGATVGPLVAVALLSARPEDFRALYFWALVPGFLSLGLLLFVRDSRSAPAVATSVSAPSSAPSSAPAASLASATPAATWPNPLRALGELGGPFRGYLTAWGIFSLANSSDAFLLLKAKALGLETRHVIFLYCGYNLVYAVSSPWLGSFSDRWGRKRLLLGGLVAFAFVYAGFGLATQTWQLWLLFSFYGLYMGATEGVGKAFAVDLIPPERKATGVGLLGTVTGLCTLGASVCAGLLWDLAGPDWVFAYGALGALAAFPFLRRVREASFFG